MAGRKCARVHVRKGQPAIPLTLNKQQGEIVKRSIQRPSQNGTAGVINSYVAFLAMEPEPHERRKQLIEEIVSDCYARYRWGVYAIIRRINLGHEDAEDILQDIMCRWARRLEVGRELPAPEALTTWFGRVARNAALSYLRRLRGKARQAEHEYGARRLGVGQNTPHFDLSLKELPKVIDRILSEKISPEKHRVFELWRQGLTYQEIAENLKGMSAEAVRGVKRKILGILREELDRLDWSIP